MSKDTFYSIVPVNWLLRTTGLSNIYRKETQLAESGSLIKTIICIIGFGLINTCFLCFKAKTFKGNQQTGLVRFADSIQLTYWFSYLEYIIDMSFVFKYSRVSFIKYIKAFDHFDTILGTPSYDEMRRTIIYSLLIAIANFLVNSLFDFVAWVQIEGAKSAMVYSIDYWYFFLNMLTVLDIISHTVQVEYRLKMICDLLQNCNNTNFIEPAFDDSTSSTAAGKPLDSLKTLCHTQYLKTAWFSKSYLLLLDQVSYINTSYGYRALVYTINLLFNMISLLNLAVRIMNGSMHATYGDGLMVYLPSVSSAMRALNYGLMGIIPVYRCEQAYRQSDRILETIDVLLASKSNCIDMKTNLLEFRNLLITRPVKFHAAKFFTIDYTLLVSLSNVVVTYTIIMLQSMQ